MSNFETESQVWSLSYQNLFDPEEVKQYTNHRKNYRVRLRLLFKPLKYSCDFSDEGYAITKYKEHDGKLYIYSVEYTKSQNRKKVERG